MGFTMVAFGESIDPAGVYVNITAVNDDHITASGDEITVPDDYRYLMGALAFLETTADEEAKLISPSLRRLNNYRVPTVVEGAGLQVPRNDAFWPDSPVPLVPDERLECQIKSNPGAATSQSCVVLLSDGPISPAPGEIYSVEFTATITSVEDTWTSGNISFTDDLPAGRYSVRGARVQGAACIAFRFIPVGGIWRPGGFCVLAEDDPDMILQRRGGLGEWFEFDQNKPPKLEVLAADTAGAIGATGVLDVVYLGT